MKDTTGPLKNNRFFLFLKKRCTCELREGRGERMKKILREEIWLVTQRTCCKCSRQHLLKNRP